VAKYACLLFANLVNMFWLSGTQLLWLSCRLVTRNKAKADRIKHVFVLMLENRSFDHLLGFSQLKGIDALTGQPTTIEGLDPARDWNAGLEPSPPAICPAIQKTRAMASTSGNWVCVSPPSSSRR
jgi:phospholipase C